MMTEETPSTDPKQQIPDLSGLADFQFGPAWARPGARQERSASYPERRSGDRQGGDRRPRRDSREGRPEFPPVISLSEIKQTFILPSPAA